MYYYTTVASAFCCTSSWQYSWTINTDLSYFIISLDSIEVLAQIWSVLSKMIFVWDTRHVSYIVICVECQTGCSTTGNCPLCLCQGIQCTSWYSQHCVSNLFFISLKNFILDTFIARHPVKGTRETRNIVTLPNLNMVSNKSVWFHHSVIFGMLIALPITLAYYVLLGLWSRDYHPNQLTWQRQKRIIQDVDQRSKEKRLWNGAQVFN